MLAIARKQDEQRIDELEEQLRLIKQPEPDTIPGKQAVPPAGSETK